MTISPAEHALPPGRGRRLFAAIGYAIRAIKALPAPLRERMLDTLSSGVSANLPPFPDVLRLVEAAGGMPDGKLWHARLLEGRPDLSAVRARDIIDDSRGRVRARLYLPGEGAAAPTAALVWVHGGAFILGSLDAREAHWTAIELAASGIPVLSVDYRMCIDGVHYPAPQDDVLAAWHWAVAHADELGVVAAQLHLGGGSAGGCLVAGATLRLRDAGEPLPASLCLMYPVLEGRLPPASPDMAEALASSKLPSDEWIAAMFGTWVGAAQQNDPFVAPALADLTGLPPTYVLTCGRDVLRRSSEPYVRRLAEAGVEVWHDLLPEAEHATLDRPGSADGKKTIALLRAWLTGGPASMVK